MPKASGSFEVKLEPKPLHDGIGETTMVRMSIDKKLWGDFEGTSKGEMLGIRTAVDGSAGYVALETVTGKLGDRTGSFVLQHNSTMNRGASQQSVFVVPDSGTEGLKGLMGKMTIHLKDGKHTYDFDYSIADAE